MRSLEEAHAEVERELNVRKRCFPGWIESGKLTRIDAKDRLERLEAAEAHLRFGVELEREQAAKQASLPGAGIDSTALAKPAPLPAVQP